MNLLLMRLVDINDYDKKKVILVDHNEMSQSVDGLEEVNMHIAKALHMTLEELLKFAETKENWDVCGFKTYVLYWKKFR